MIVVLKMIFNFHKSGLLSATPSAEAEFASLFDLEEGCTAILGDFEMPEQLADQLMNLGFVPGLEVKVTRSGPWGDPRIYRVDGVEVALRRDVAERMRITHSRRGKTAVAEVPAAEGTDRVASSVETRRYAGPEGVTALTPTIEEAGD